MTTLRMCTVLVAVAAATLTFLPRDSSSASPTTMDEVPGEPYEARELRRPDDARALRAYHEKRAQPFAATLYRPERYDLAAIESDAGYYERIDYTRRFQSAAGSDPVDRPPLIARSPLWQLGRPDAWARFDLIVQAPAGRPVSFFAPQCGSFPNGRNMITIRSDAHGLARTRFRFGPGTGAYVAIATCPETAREVSFHLECTRDPGKLAAWGDAMEVAIADRDGRFELRADGLLTPRPKARRDRGR